MHNLYRVEKENSEKSFFVCLIASFFVYMNCFRGRGFGVKRWRHNTCFMVIILRIYRSSLQIFWNWIKHHMKDQLLKTTLSSRLQPFLSAIHTWEMLLHLIKYLWTSPKECRTKKELTEYFQLVLVWQEFFCLLLPLDIHAHPVDGAPIHTLEAWHVNIG